MANWYGTSRSNYFRVRDEEEFAALVAPHSVEIIRDAEGRVGLIADTEFGDWPTEVATPGADGQDDYVEFDLPAEIGPLLDDGEVAIFMTAGAEKARYVTGHAIAINNKGETREIYLSDIMGLARQLGPNVTDASF